MSNIPQGVNLCYERNNQKLVGAGLDEVYYLGAYQIVEPINRGEDHIGGNSKSPNNLELSLD